MDIVLAHKPHGIIFNAAALFLSSVCLFLMTGCNTDEETLVQPELSVEEYGIIPAEGGEFTIGCKVTNPFEYGILRVYCDADWIQSAEIIDGKAVLEVEKNEGDSDREAILRLTYPECDPLEITIVQAHYSQSDGLPVEIGLELDGNVSIKASFHPLFDGRTYYIGCVPSYKIGEDNRSFIDSVVASIEQEAEEENMFFSAVVARYIAEGDSEKEFSSLQPETDYSVFAFALDVEGRVGYLLNVAEIRTGAYQMPDLTFSLEEVSVRQRTLKMRCTPSSGDVHYIYHCTSMQEYSEVYGEDDQQLICEMVEECRTDLENLISQGLGNFTLWDYCDTGVKEREFKQLTPDSEYYVFAFAITQDGCALGPVSKVLVKTRPEEITDDCTFNISFSDIKSDSFNVRIEPSDNSTRYYAYLAGSGILDTYTPERVASLMISMANDSGIDWNSSQYVFTGTRDLDSYYDLGSPRLEADSPYTVFVFGVNGYGERTTDVAWKECITAEVEMSDMTIGFDYTVNGPSSVDVVYVPSTQEPYFYGCITAEEYDKAESEESLIEAIIAKSVAEGSFTTVTGRHEHQLMGNYLRASTEYVLYAFGYSGDVTTRLFTERFTTPERVFSDATLEFSYEILDGNDIYSQNPALNYGYQNRAAVVFTVKPSGASSWYFSGFGNSRSYLEALDQEELIYTIEMNGRKNYNKYQVMYAADWNSIMSCAGYGVDAAGKEGRPVILEVRVPGKSN